MIPKSKRYPWIQNRLIYVTRAGSDAYGTAVPGSDHDIRGIAVPPTMDLFGFNPPFEQFEQKSPNDVVVYDIRKFMRLASEGNPNIIEMLFTDDADRIFINQQGVRLIMERDKLLTKVTADRFCAFALSRVPELERSAKRRKYTTTEETRRDERIKEFGYDTKDAMHAVRVIRMAREMLEGKGLIVKRPDAAELLDILNGKWSLDEVTSWIGESAIEVNTARHKSELPEVCKVDEINEACHDTVMSSFDHEVVVPAMDGGGPKGWGAATQVFGLGMLRPKLLSKVIGPKEEA